MEHVHRERYSNKALNSGGRKMDVVKVGEGKKLTFLGEGGSNELRIFSL